MEKILEIRRKAKLSSAKDSNTIRFGSMSEFITDIAGNKYKILPFIAVFVIVVIAAFLFSDKYSSKRAAEGLINAWVVGNDGAEYWSGFAENRARLFNVKSYHHISSKKLPKLEQSRSNMLEQEANRMLFDMYVHRFRIQSTTKGGMPIEVLWDIYVAYAGERWTVIKIQESI
jgi:hypothetical protein